MRQGIVSNIQAFNVHDGPGIRTVVFFKGCPLRCLWCCNPESISPSPELGLVIAVCDRCGKCLDACSRQALSFDDQSILQVDRSKCTACGKCAAVCNPGALTVYGREMTAAEVLEEVHRDKMFYEGSGGGVTASGGEPLQQSRFVAALFRLCRDSGIHTCLETSGHASASAWKRVLPFADYVIFDLKHMDPQVHRELTGSPNRHILENAQRAARSGIPVLFRMPLVPGCNDSLENIQATAQFVKGLGNENIQGIELMPYHRLGTGKYQALDKRYMIETTKPPQPSEVESVQQRFAEFGLKCTVSR